MNPVSTDHPSQTAARLIKPIEDFSEQSIERWISQLPLSNVNAACEAIYGLLRTLNTTDNLECLDRQRIVEQIRPPTVSLVAMGSEQHLPKSTLFPLPESQHKYTQQNVDVCLELANAYRRIVTSGTFFSDKVMNDAMRAQNIYRALQAYGLALLRSLERYESPPDGFWREAYAFYRFAEGHRLHVVSLPAPEIEGATVDSQFKQMVLLALSSHQHHAPDEIRQFYTALMLIARDAQIQKTSEKGDESALFYFDMGSDSAPRPVKRAKSVLQGERRFVFTGQMLNSAREYFANPAHRATDRFKLRNEVILSLLEALAASEKRRFVRKPASGKRRFVVGLSRLVEELSGVTHDQPADDLASKTEQLEANTAAEEETYDVEIVLDQDDGAGPDEIWVKSASSVFLNKPAPAKKTGSSASRTAPVYDITGELTGALLNASAGGYCIGWLNALVAGARVGELIGIYEDERRIHVGVIRWLHHKARAELVIGVELLSPVVEAVEVETGPEGDSLRSGLYFSANQKLGQPDSLLCAPATFKASQNIALRSKSGRLQFRLEKLLGTTLSFQLFSLARP